MSKIEIISSLKDYGGCVMDVADEMKDRISTLESTNDTVVSTSNLLKEEVEQLKKDLETAKHDNYQLKNTIESLMNLTVAVPYEKGSYLRAIGATRIVKLGNYFKESLKYI